MHSRKKNVQIRFKGAPVRIAQNYFAKILQSDSLCHWLSIQLQTVKNQLLQIVSNIDYSIKYIGGVQTEHILLLVNIFIIIFLENIK